MHKRMYMKYVLNIFYFLRCLKNILFIILFNFFTFYLSHVTQLSGSPLMARNVDLNLKGEDRLISLSILPMNVTSDLRVTSSRFLSGPLAVVQHLAL